MTNPQLENGYTKIANQIMEELAKIRIPGQARQVLDFIIRKTYGWNKKTNVINLVEFTNGTGLSKVAICKGLNKLLEMNLITKKGNAKSLFTKKGNDTAITYGFQKNYKQWNTLPKKVTSKTRYPKRKSTLPKKVTPPLKEKVIKEKSDFDKFYKKYPIKKSKAKALESWQKLKQRKILPRLDIILTAINDQESERQRKISNNKFCAEWKHPATWLNQHCWEDEVDKPVTNIKTEKVFDGYITDIKHYEKRK